MSKRGRHIIPPGWPLKLLRFFIKDEYLEEIEGDMEERFCNNLESFSTKKARRLFLWDTLKLLRPTLMKGIDINYNFNQYDMFRHNLILSLRNYVLKF